MLYHDYVISYDLSKPCGNEMKTLQVINQPSFNALNVIQCINNVQPPISVTHLQI
jgi:hypothetical protein